MHDRISWRHDAPASVVVFLVAVPLCLGIALASGAPLFSGIIAGIVGGIVVGMLSDSQLMVSGPAAGLTVIVLAAITELGGFETFLAAVVIAGAMQVLFGALRAGVVGYYFPSAVIKGMLTAIGLMLILKQIPHALGYDVDAMGDDAFMQSTAQSTVAGLMEAFRQVQWGAVIVAGISLPLLFLWGRGPLARFRDVPAPLVIVLLGLVLNSVYGLVAPGLVISETHLVSLPMPDSVEAFFGQFSTPRWSAMLEPAVWKVAVTLAIVASLESLLSLQATDDMDPWHREASTDRELLAQGTGNMVSGLIGGLPITGVIVRSATNIASGAKTRWSAVLHGVWLLVAVLAIPGLLNRIPLAALAAVLIHVGYKLASPALFRSAVARGRAYAFSFVFTVVAIIATDLLRGILAGLAVGVIVILRDHVQSPPYTEISAPGAVLRRLQLHDNVNFLHKAALTTMLEALPHGSRVELDARRTRRLDADVLEVIGNFQRLAPQRDIDLRLVGFPAPDRTPQ